MNMEPSARVALVVALEETGNALTRMAYRVKEVPDEIPGNPPDLKFVTLIGGVEVVYCTPRQIRKRVELDYETAGAITAYCALFYTLNPPPGV